MRKVIVICVISLAIILFAPIPYYQKSVVCKPGQVYCPPTGWYLKPSLFEYLYEIFIIKVNQSEAIIIKTPPSTGSAAPTGQVSNGNLANWKTYTNTKIGYSLEFPETWILEENCKQLVNVVDFPCIYTSDFRQVIKRLLYVQDGGGDTLIEYNVGNLLRFHPLAIYNYNLTSFCSPGGAGIVEKCKERKISDTKFAFRETGDYPFETNIVDVWFLKDNKALFELQFHFSKANKQTDLILFDQILSTFKFTN